MSNSQPTQMDSDSGCYRFLNDESYIDGVSGWYPLRINVLQYEHHPNIEQKEYLINFYIDLCAFGDRHL